MVKTKILWKLSITCGPRRTNKRNKNQTKKRKKATIAGSRNNLNRLVEHLQTLEYSTRT